MSAQPTASERLVALVKNVGITDEDMIRILVDYYGDPGKCRGCDADIWWITHANKAKTPYTREGLNHFVDCPKASQFRR